MNETIYPHRLFSLKSQGYQAWRQTHEGTTAVYNSQNEHDGQVGKKDRKTFSESNLQKWQKLNTRCLRLGNVPDVKNYYFISTMQSDA